MTLSSGSHDFSPPFLPPPTHWMWYSTPLLLDRIARILSTSTTSPLDDLPLAFAAGLAAAFALAAGFLAAGLAAGFLAAGLAATFAIRFEATALTLTGFAAALTGFLAAALAAGFAAALGAGAALGAAAALALGASTFAFFALGADAGSGAPRFGRVSESGVSLALGAAFAGDFAAAFAGDLAAGLAAALAAGFAAAFAGAGVALAGALVCDLLYATIISLHEARLAVGSHVLSAALKPTHFTSYSMFLPLPREPTTFSGS
mmetsp:Transcript_1545/g.3432  ORF Transcript_1545/g.3432 Transcript_1545/m.3432 type:complete len:261 (-) Transcript_1545:94-876(-)